jgi:FAD/FMN-containing dehydrogenase
VSLQSGSLRLPGSPGYEQARRPAIARFHDVEPAAVARCHTDADVAAALAFGRSEGLHVALRSGGHCFAGRSSTEGLVIDVSPMSSVTLDHDVVTVGAGARLGSVYDALERLGRTIAAGCGPDVGVAGLTLGGGLGILGRLYGLTADALLAARVVLADGRVVEASEPREPALFWALRGAGGGQFGVVTSLSFRTLPAPPLTTSIHLVWPHEHAAAVLAAWQDWSPDAPDALAASLLLTAPSDPARSLSANVVGAMAAPSDSAAALVAELVERVGDGPLSSVLVEAPYRQTKRRLAAHGPGEEVPGGHPYCKSEFFRERLPSQAIDRLVELLAADRRAGESRELDFTPWGGAYNRIAADETAFPHRDARFLLKPGVVLTPGADRDATRRWLAEACETTHPYGTGGAYVNFPDPELEDWARAYHGANLERLEEIKAAYDPDAVFRFPQSLSPAAQAGRRTRRGQVLQSSAQRLYQLGT